MAYIDEIRVDGVSYMDGEIDSIYVKTPDGYKRFVPAVSGRWEAYVDQDEFWGDISYFQCSYCKAVELMGSPFCPNCGAKMEVDSGG